MAAAALPTQNIKLRADLILSSDTRLILSTQTNESEDKNPAYIVQYISRGNKIQNFVL